MTEEKKKIIALTERYVKKKLIGESSGHDWWHVYRVWSLAKHIGIIEKADLFIIELAALLHDIADWKFHGGDEQIGPRKAREWLEKQHVEKNIVEEVCNIIASMSFRGAGSKSIAPLSLEGQIVQDADRLDALGAIGIARCFAYGGFMKREIYNPHIKPSTHQSNIEYKNNTSPSINHFYEKLLLIKDLMNTKTGKTLAIKKHRFMKQFLTQFYKEISM